MREYSIKGIRPAGCVKHMTRYGYTYYILEFDVPAKHTRLVKRAWARGFERLARRLNQLPPWERVVIKVESLNQSGGYRALAGKEYVSIPAKVVRQCIQECWGMRFVESKWPSSSAWL